jgi:hypothetical protein
MICTCLCVRTQRMCVRISVCIFIYTFVIHVYSVECVQSVTHMRTALCICVLFLYRTTAPVFYSPAVVTTGFGRGLVGEGYARACLRTLCIAHRPMIRLGMKGRVI